MKLGCCGDVYRLELSYLVMKNLRQGSRRQKIGWLSSVVQMLQEHLKPVVIGKYAKPRCFKNVNMRALPASYKNQRSAWMNSEIFAEWFKNDFVPAVKRHQRAQNIRSPKALLLMDNCSAHPEELRSRSVTCMFLPPNTTSLIQPMDQGVLQAAKNRYKRKLL